MSSYRFNRDLTLLSYDTISIYCTEQKEQKEQKAISSFWRGPTLETVDGGKILVTELKKFNITV